MEKGLVIRAAILAFVVGILAGTLTGCTENTMAKQYGGTITEKIPCDRKIVTVTWKGDQLWTLTRPMTADDVPESYTFHESSSWGVMEGTVKYQESRCKK